MSWDLDRQKSVLELNPLIPVYVGNGNGVARVNWESFSYQKKLQFPDELPVTIQGRLKIADFNLLFWCLLELHNILAYFFSMPHRTTLSSLSQDNHTIIQHNTRLLPLMLKLGASVPVSFLWRGWMQLWILEGLTSASRAVVSHIVLRQSHGCSKKFEKQIIISKVKYMTAGRKIHKHFIFKIHLKHSLGCFLFINMSHVFWWSDGEADSMYRCIWRMIQSSKFSPVQACENFLSFYLMLVLSVTRS